MDTDTWRRGWRFWPALPPRAALPAPSQVQQRNQLSPNRRTHPGEPDSFRQKWESQLTSQEQTYIWNKDLFPHHHHPSCFCQPLQLPTALCATSRSAAPGQGTRFIDKKRRQWYGTWNSRSYPASVTQKQLAFQNNGVSIRPYEVSYGARGKPMTCQGECCLVGRSVCSEPANTLQHSFSCRQNARVRETVGVYTQ